MNTTYIHTEAFKVVPLLNGHPARYLKLVLESIRLPRCYIYGDTIVSGHSHLVCCTILLSPGLALALVFSTAFRLSASSKVIIGVFMCLINKSYNLPLFSKTYFIEI